MNKVKFDSKMIIDVIGASLIVQQAPKLIDQVVQLDPMLRTVAGVGVGYLAGSFLKRPTIANASIALGAVEFVAPMLDSLLGGGGANLPPNSSSLIPITPPKGLPAITPDSVASLEKYFSLNEYISNPSEQMGYDDYRTSYK
jgi:hypothetical protein